MKKQKRKELESALYQLIDAHLSHHNVKVADKVQKVVRSSAKNIAKKFSKALRRNTGSKKAAKSNSRKSSAGKN